MLETRYVQVEIHGTSVIPRNHFYGAVEPADREKITNQGRGRERIAPNCIRSPSEQGSPGECEFQIRRHMETEFFSMEQEVGDIRATANLTSAVRRINTIVCNGSTPESSLHLGQFERGGQVQI